MDDSHVSGFHRQVFHFLADIPFQHLQLDLLEPQEAVLCSGRIGAIGLRGHLTSTRGLTCRFIVWQYKTCPENGLDLGVRTGWVLRGVDRPEQFENHKDLGDFKVALTTFFPPGDQP